MTTDERAELKRLAEMADGMEMVLSPSGLTLHERGTGPVDRIVYYDSDGDITEVAQTRMRFIAAAKPVAVLGLLARIERLEQGIAVAINAAEPRLADALIRMLEEDGRKD